MVAIFRLEFPQLKLLQNIEDLRYMNAAGAGWWKTIERVSGKFRHNWRAHFGLIICKIFFSNQAAVLFHPLRGFFGKLTFIKIIRTLFGKLAVSRGEIFLF